MKPELLIRIRTIIGEGPVWDEETGALYFIDILDGKIYRYQNEALTSVTLPEHIGFAVLREKGGMIAGTESGFQQVEFPEKGMVFLANPYEDQPEHRFNDGKVDPAGRVFGGTMPVALDSGYGEAGPDSGLYALLEDGTTKQVLSGIIQGNGLAWSEDGGTFYFIDTQRRTVTRYKYDIDAVELSDPEVVIRVPDELGIPDGMTIDEEGKLWIGLWGGSALGRWDPDTGELMTKIEFPALNVTSCCFGGPNMDELYVTTASTGTDLEQYPEAGSVYVLRPGVRGAKSYKYKG